MTATPAEQLNDPPKGGKDTIMTDKEIRQHYRDLVARHVVVADAIGPDDHRIGVVNSATTGGRYLRPNVFRPRTGPGYTGGLIELTPSTRDALLRYLAGDRDAAALAAHHTMVHETLHGCGPLPRVGAVRDVVEIDECITELAARHVSGVDPVQIRYGGGYQRLIDDLVRSSGIPELELQLRAIAHKRRPAVLATADQQIADLLRDSNRLDDAAAEDYTTARWASVESSEVAELAPGWEDRAVERARSAGLFRRE